MKKYVRYQLVAEYGEVIENFEDYSEAFGSYQRADEPKTLYGYSEEGEPSVIFSKG